MRVDVLSLTWQHLCRREEHQASTEKVSQVAGGAEPKPVPVMHCGAERTGHAPSKVAFPDTVPAFLLIYTS